MERGVVGDVGMEEWLLSMVSCVQIKCPLMCVLSSGLGLIKWLS